MRKKSPKTPDRFRSLRAKIERNSKKGKGTRSWGKKTKGEKGVMIQAHGMVCKESSTRRARIVSTPPRIVGSEKKKEKKKGKGSPEEKKQTVRGKEFVCAWSR